MPDTLEPRKANQVSSLAELGVEPDYLVPGSTTALPKNQF
jgi:hypothetical protein